MLQLRGFRLAAAVLSGALLYVSLSLTPWWAAAWVAPIPILLAAFYASAKESRNLAWLTAAIGVSSNFTYYLKVTGPVATLVLLLLEVLMWVLFVTQTRIAVRGSKRWTILYVFPIFFAALDMLISFFSPHGTWSSFAYTQMDALPVIQIASILGAPAVVFIVALFSSTVAIALYHGGEIEHPALAYGLPILLIGGVIGYGAVRLYDIATPNTVTVGVASIDEYIGTSVSSTQAKSVWNGYDTLVTRLAHSGAQIIVLPEKIAVLEPDAAATREAALKLLANRNAVYLDVGIQLNHATHKDNVSWLFGPQGELLAEYHKQQLVPHLESDLTPGHDDTIRTIDGKIFGLAICRDLLFTSLGRRYGRLGSSAMLVPAWDFYSDACMESAAADLRGVESGYGIVRAGRESFLNVSDRYGHIIARRRSEGFPGSSILAKLPLDPTTPTIYARYGDVFGWLCVVVMIVLRLRDRTKHIWPFDHVKRVGDPSSARSGLLH